MLADTAGKRLHQGRPRAAQSDRVRRQPGPRGRSGMASWRTARPVTWQVHFLRLFHNRVRDALRGAKNLQRGNNRQAATMVMPPKSVCRGCLWPVVGA